MMADEFTSLWSESQNFIAGPKDQQNSRFRARLKISSENEIFERATHCGPIFRGENRDVEIEIFERD